MRLVSSLMAVLLLASFSLAIGLIACEDEGDEYRKHPLMAEDGKKYAKDKDPDEDCNLDDLFVEDCLDACTCCFQGASELVETCVEYCDAVLIRYQDYQADNVDITNYKECVVGCFSVCGEHRDEICWEECRGYIDED